jgi:predicted TPR repeat methyltransferase
VFTGVDISPAMNAQAKAKNIYRDLVLSDLNFCDCPGKFHVVVSTGTFALGHVGLDRIFGILDKNMVSGGLMMLTIKSTHFDQEISNRLEEMGCKVQQEQFQHFDYGATAELLTIWKGSKNT